MTMMIEFLMRMTIATASPTQLKFFMLVYTQMHDSPDMTPTRGRLEVEFAAN